MRATVRTILSTCADERGFAALEQVTPPLRRLFVEANTTSAACSSVLGIEPLGGEARAPGKSSAFEEARVERVETRGGFATAKVALPGRAGPVELELESSGDPWLISNPVRPRRSGPPPAG